MMVDIDKMRRQRDLQKKAEAAMEQRQASKPKAGPGVKVTRRPNTKRQKAVDIVCEYDGDDVVGIHFDSVEAATKKAALFVIGGDEVWIPFSQLKDVDVNAQALLCSEWIADQKGLEADW